MNISALYERFCGLRQELLQVVALGAPASAREERIRHAVEGSIKFADACVLARLLEQHRPQRVLEIGSFLGFSTRWISEACSGWKCEVTAIDPNIKHRIFAFPKEILLEYNKKFIVSGRLNVLTAFFGEPFVERDVAWRYDNERKNEADYVENLVNDIPVIDASHSGRYDFIFIDGAHHYQAVSSNFSIARQLLNENGVVTFHDAVSWKEVNAFLNELRSQKHMGKTEILSPEKIFAHPALQREPIKTVDGIGYFRSAARAA